MLDPLLIRLDAIPNGSRSRRTELDPDSDADADPDLNRLGSLCCCWSRPALTFTRRRYSESESTVTSGFLAVPSGTSQVDYSALRWTARLLSVLGKINQNTDRCRDLFIVFLIDYSGQQSLLLERGKVEETLFDWPTWRLVAQAGRLALQLLSSAVRQSAIRWLDSHLWLLERSLPWINQADCDQEDELTAQHLAAQMAVSLKPYAGLIN